MPRLHTMWVAIVRLHTMWAVFVMGKTVGKQRNMMREQDAGGLLGEVSSILNSSGEESCGPSGESCGPTTNPVKSEAAFTPRRSSLVRTATVDSSGEVEIDDAGDHDPPHHQHDVEEATPPTISTDAKTTSTGGPPSSMMRSATVSASGEIELMADTVAERSVSGADGDHDPAHDSTSRGTADHDHEQDHSSDDHQHRTPDDHEPTTTSTSGPAHKSDDKENPSAPPLKNAKDPPSAPPVKNAEQESSPPPTKEASAPSSEQTPKKRKVLGREPSGSPPAPDQVGAQKTKTKLVGREKK